MIVVDYVDPVLVVDDLNTMTRIVDGMLRKCGFTNVEQCHDGPTALQKLREKPFLFMMTDREMPGMNGLELAHEARRLRPGLPVLLTSGYEREAAEESPGSPTPFELLRKPYRREELAQALRAVIAADA